LVYYILFGIFILACIVLIVAVLLQPGKADAGALFTSSVSSTAFGPRGTQSILAKVTIGAAVSFMLVALILSLPALSGPHSVMRSGKAQTGTATPTLTPTPAPASAPAAIPATASPATVDVKPAASPQAKPSPEKKNK
jgi:preprotein translocase subunit SecG